MNANLPDEQSAYQENSAKDFLTILNNIMGKDCLMGDAMGTQKDIVTQQPSALDSIYPVLLSLIQNISNVDIQKGKDADVDNKDPSQHQPAEKENNDPIEIDLAGMDAASINAILPFLTKKENNDPVKIDLAGMDAAPINAILPFLTKKENNDSVQIDLTGMDAASINVILPFLDSIAGALNKTGGEVKLDIVETVYKYVNRYNVTDMDAQDNTSDDIVLISAKNRIENTEEGRVGKFLSDELAGAEQKEKTVMPAVCEPMENIMTMPVISNFYLKAEQLVAKKGEEGENVRIPPIEDKAPTEYFVLGKSNKENNMHSMPVDGAKKELVNEPVDNAEILMKDIARSMKQGSNREREASFINYKQIDLDIRNAQSKGKENGIQVLFAQGGKLLDESMVKQKEEVTEPLSKDLKLMFKDNDYMSYTKQDRFANPLVQEAQNQKGVSNTSFSSVMMEKIEKIIEQYSAKGTSMDMIVRLKIDDSETLLVGLKNEGQRVMVDVKTTSGGVINILQTQKDVIVRNLEEKNIYTNIFIDPDSNGNFDRREARRENQRNDRDNGKQTDFIEFLETV